MPERARYVVEVTGHFFLADPDTGREFTSRERTLPEDLPERRPYRRVSLRELVSAWFFRQRVHLRSKGSDLTITHSIRLTPPSQRGDTEIPFGTP